MKIKHSLSLKVFIVTFILQLLTGVLICGLLYAFVPESVSREERDEKEASFYSFVDDLNSVTLEDSGDIIDAYILSEDVSVVFYRGTRLEFSTPIVATPSKYAALTSLEVNRYYDSLPEDAEMFISSSEIRFIDQDTDFLVVVTGAYSEDSVIPAAIVKCLPIIIPILILISIGCSCLCSVLFARPIRKMSEVSSAMADMDFTKRNDYKRKDEIGAVANDLDKMADRLDETMKELKCKNEALESELHRVNELESQKTMFFAAAAHELKTPVTVLEGQITGMIDGVKPYDDKEASLPKLLRNVRRMSDLINEIFTASKLDTGRGINGTRVEISSLLSQAVASIEELAFIKEISIVKSVDDDLVTSGDPEMLLKAINAFLSNAVFYSGEGASVEIDCHAEDSDIRIEIRNSDAHIDEEDLPHLFEAFYRADRSRSRATGGSGLGLYIAKKIIDAHGGSCSLQNSGSDVLATINLPLST